MAKAKYERVYRRAYDTVSHAKSDIDEYLGWNNTKRQHTRMEQQTPDQAHRKWLPPMQAAV